MPRRDMDLVRDLLLKIEAIDDPANDCTFSFDDRPAVDVDHHMAILHDAGLVSWGRCSGSSEGNWYRDLRMTWDGHEFLDNARSETVWNDAKRTLSDGPVKSAAFGIWTTILTRIVAKNIGLD